MLTFPNLLEEQSKSRLASPQPEEGRLDINWLSSTK